MKLHWRQFQVYLDSFTWIVREESEEGRKDNVRDDLNAMKEIPELKDAKQSAVDEVKRKLASHPGMVKRSRQMGKDM
jgi:hypothetical protein